MHIASPITTDNPFADLFEDVREGRYLLDRLAAAIDDVEQLTKDFTRQLARIEGTTALIARSNCAARSKPHGN